MTLRPPIEGLNERMCVFGTAGTGKSYDFYTIARLASRRESDAKFWIIDLDMSAEMMLTDPEFADINLDNVRVYHPHDLETLITTLEEVQGKISQDRISGGLMGTNDWMLIDMITPAWRWAQDWYTRTYFKQTFADYMEKRKRDNPKADSNPFQPDQWGIINTEYGKINTRLLRGPGNLFCTAQQKGIPTNASPTERVEFGPIGFMPAGQKDLAHQFHACFHKTMSVRDGGQYLISSAKNRSRPVLQSVEIKDFALTVLVGNRGWKL